ncbi:hypothetical protein GMORB2_3191 [Geosmithia morbida]|uniref:AB hydrolase-1 domain-containing protein n=1 Tax=Geosmithia morbida TaxID=1094350 RepID=A0A9P4YPK7_9HYPO|nr:uncharacterized protein GMORB2_3191 [Geosmithia morbida]KAF4120390.1 hypothetical protein GMORB2_3191 [Geosmithia morbida]
MADQKFTTWWAVVHIAIILFRYTPCLYVAGIASLFLINGSGAWDLTSMRILCGALTAEAVYYLSAWRPYHARLNLPAEYPELWPATRKERRELFDECFAHVSEPEAYLRWWFLGSDRHDIRRDNVREFITWGFFDRDSLYPDVHPEDAELQKEIDEYVAAFEKKLGSPLAEGRGPAKSLRLTVDPIQTAYRGLAWYSVVFLIDQLTHLSMALMGFRYHPPAEGAPVFPPRPQVLLASETSPASSLGYWFKPHRAGPDTLPVVFFHGIGIGLWTYLRFFCGISKPNDNGSSLGVIAIEMLPISFRLTSPLPRQSEFVRQVTNILDYHGWDQVSAVSHSYGSVPTTHIIRSPELKHRVTSVVLLDPVTILLHLPYVAYNFTRRAPSATNEWVLWYFASTDPGVAHCLGRHFFWRHNAVFKRELLAPVPIHQHGHSDRAQSDGSAQLGRDSSDSSNDDHIYVRPRRVAVCLSGRDLIVETGAVAQYLTQQEEPKGGESHIEESTITRTDDSIEVMIFPDLDHAQIFTTAKDTSRVIDLVKNYCKI